MRKTWIRWIACAVLSLTAACDLKIEHGDVVVLSNDGLVLGSFPEPGELHATPAAQLFPGGTLIVENASLLGGNVRVSEREKVAFPGARGCL